MSTDVFGTYGGRYVPETLIPALDELERGWREALNDEPFRAELDELLATYAGRPTPLTLAERFAPGKRIYLKREDLLHTGAHKLNNALGQAVLARRLGKRRIVAETGAGMHGVAAATVCARFGFECVVYMGEEDMRRQRPNVERMQLLGAEVRAVDFGTKTLKEATSEAIRDWITNVETTHYLIGSCVGPAPYPELVAELQSVIGREAREQLLAVEQRLPEAVVACVGGGSNAIGIFHGFLADEDVRLVGVEAAGAASLGSGRAAVLHGARSSVLADYGRREWTRFEDGRTPGPSLTTHIRMLEGYVRPGDRALDAGSGPGRFTLELLRLGAHVTALDISPGQLELLQARVPDVEAIVGDITDLSGFPDDGFDVTVCFGGPLSYVVDRAERAVAELARVRRPGGHVLVSVMGFGGPVIHFAPILVELAPRDGPAKSQEIVRTGVLPEGEGYGPLAMRLSFWEDLAALLAN